MLTICSREKERKKERESWIKYACCYLIIEEGSLYNSKDDEMDQLEINDNNVVWAILGDRQVIKPFQIPKDPQGGAFGKMAYKNISGM